MFALGFVLDPEEFKETVRRPKEIGLGLATQFTVMPLLGFLAATFGGLGREIALGFVIVGHQQIEMLAPYRSESGIEKFHGRPVVKRISIMLMNHALSIVPNTIKNIMINTSNIIAMYL